MSYQIPFNHNSIKNLRDFYAPQAQLFENATELPQFFQTNLVDDARVVKYFGKDPQANIRIFYYQYLKLCFEIDNVDYEGYIEKIYELIRTQGFEFYFDSNDQQKQYKNAQYKSLLVDFFEIMNSSSLTIDQILTQYPILDKVFINFFRSVLMIASLTNEFNSYIDKNELFDFLSSLFSVDISSYDKCLKFVESDIFVYEEDPQNIYMAYIRDDEGEDVKQENQNLQQNDVFEVIAKKANLIKLAMENKEFSISKEVSENTISEENNSSIAPSSQFSNNQLKPRAKIMIRQSYIEGQFADYTSYHHSKGISAFGKNLSADFQKEVSQGVQKNGTFIQHETTQTNTKVTSEIERKQYIEKQHNRFLSAKNQSKFELDPTCDQHKFSQRLTSRTERNQVKNDPSPQKDQKPIESQPIESQCDQSRSLIANLESEQHLESQEMSNSKDNSKKQIAFNRKHIYQNYQQPTKDPGFGSSQGINVSPVQQPNYHQHKPKYSLLSYESSSLIQNEKPLYIPEPLFHKPTIPIPTLLNQNNLSQNGRVVTSQKFLKYSQSPAVNTVGLSAIKQNFKLNVTKQFTNSFVMKTMNEPFKYNVQKMRERARQFRKNIYQELNYQTVKTVSTYEYEMTKIPSSRINYPSSPSTLQKLSSQNKLMIKSDIKNDVQSIKNINSQEKSIIQAKFQSQSNTNLLSRKLFEINESTSSVSEQSSKVNIPSDKERQNTLKEAVIQSQLPNKAGQVISMGPSIVVVKHNQHQSQRYSQINYQQKSLAYQGNNVNQYQMAQQNAYKRISQNAYHMNKPPSHNYEKVLPNPSTHYANNLQTTQPFKMYKEQPVYIYKQQANNGVYSQGNKGQIPRTVNGPEMLYNQQIKKPFPVLVPYVRRT